MLYFLKDLCTKVVFGLWIEGIFNCDFGTFRTYFDFFCPHKKK
jgi:hypothetical protein